MHSTARGSSKKNINRVVPSGPFNVVAIVNLKCKTMLIKPNIYLIEHCIVAGVKNVYLAQHISCCKQCTIVIEIDLQNRILVEINNVTVDLT
jgi:hypothetical protein